MIVRVLTAIVPAESSGQLHVLMREQLPLLREYDGLIYVKLARRLIGPQEEIILFEEWRDTAAMYEWTGPDISRARLLPGAESLITDLRITHYEALDIDPQGASGKRLAPIAQARVPTSTPEQRGAERGDPTQAVDREGTGRTIHR